MELASVTSIVESLEETPAAAAAGNLLPQGLTFFDFFLVGFPYKKWLKPTSFNFFY